MPATIVTKGDQPLAALQAAITEREGKGETVVSVVDYGMEWLIVTSRMTPRKVEKR